MRQTPLAAGFQPCPGSVSRAAKLGTPALAKDVSKGVTLRAMPLAVADLIKSRRESPIGRAFIARIHSHAIRFTGI
jgi:hypothetical protein